MPGRSGWRFVPGASFEGGLDIVAPIEVRPRAVPRLATQALRGRPGADDVLVGHDLDRIVIRCDVPLPVQVDGEDIGDTQEAEIVAVRDALTVLTVARCLNSVGRDRQHPLRWLPWRTRSRCRIWARADRREIARWLVREGDAVVENEPIVEIQTDKATVEVGSPVDGVVLRILAQDGEMAEVEPRWR